MDRPRISLPQNGNNMSALRLLDLTMPTPAENLALDDALLDELEEQGGDPVLRFWESDCHFVVLGRSSRIDDDVYVDACTEDGLQVLRRASGGGTVLQGPGCLSYALVAPFTLHPQLANIRSTNQYVLERIAAALQRWEPSIVIQGISDLTVGGMKISGNAQRRSRKSMLFHGTIIYAMQSTLIARYLKEPARQPEYREHRTHRAFLQTIDVPPGDVKQAIACAWAAGSPLDRFPDARMAQSVQNVLERTAATMAAVK
jgi:lipoate-protein ligase A